jgi:Mn2+/Fe2+ NRAMP family transporter
MMAAVQFIRAKIGMVSGMGLAGVLRKHYPRSVIYTAIGLLVIANTINAGTDIFAMAAALNLLLPFPSIALVVLIAIIIVIVQI